MLAAHILYICKQWYNDCARTNKAIFGSDDNARAIAELLETVHPNLVGDLRDEALALRQSIANYL